MGEWKKRGEENLTKDTSPKNCFGPSLRLVRFLLPSGASTLFFLYKSPRMSRPEALLEGTRKFQEDACFGSPTHPPPYHGPIQSTLRFEDLSSGCGSAAKYLRPRMLRSKPNHPGVVSSPSANVDQQFTHRRRMLNRRYVLSMHEMLLQHWRFKQKGVVHVLWVEKHNYSPFRYFCPPVCNYFELMSQKSTNTAC